MDMSQYKELFIAEVREHLRGMTDSVMALEQEPGDREKIDSLFRLAHSIKGMAASMGYDTITELAHKMEDLMDAVRKGVFVFNPGIADLLLEGGDRLVDMINDVDAGGTGDRDIAGLVQRIAGYSPAAPPCGPPSKEGEPLSSEPLLQRDNVKATDIGKVIPQAEDSTGGPVTPQTVRVRTDVLDSLINLTGELITNKNKLFTISRHSEAPGLDMAVAELSRLLRELHNEVLKVRLMPFSAIADRFSRLVRDLAKKSGKEISFRLAGKEIEMDRGILEELTDPLLHILRNAVDHGLESPEERLEAGKTAAGSISIEVNREKDRIVVVVSDDGRGMDPARLVDKAVEKGLLSREDGEALTPRQAFMLICIPGFSTARTVTDVSGRGVGMDVVRASLQSLGGTLAIESEPGRGSRFILSLPLTVSIIQILLVACSSLVVAFPVAKILRTIDIGRDTIISRGQRKLFMLGEEEVPIISLHRLLGISVPPLIGPGLAAVVVELRNRKVGLVVDRFIGQQDVFVKPLGRPLNRMKGFSGGAVLGDGQVVYILDPATLI